MNRFYLFPFNYFEQFVKPTMKPDLLAGAPIALSYNSTDCLTPGWNYLQFTFYDKNTNILNAGITPENLKTEPVIQKYTLSSGISLIPKGISDTEISVIVPENEIVNYYFLLDLNRNEKINIPGYENLGNIRFYFYQKTLKRMGDVCEILLKLDIGQSYSYKLLLVQNANSSVSDNFAYKCKRTNGYPLFDNMSPANKIDPLLSFSVISPSLTTLAINERSTIGKTNSIINNGFHPEATHKLTGLMPYLYTDTPSTLNVLNPKYYVFRFPSSFGLITFYDKRIISVAKNILKFNDIYAFPVYDTNIYHSTIATDMGLNPKYGETISYFETDDNYNFTRFSTPSTYSVFKCPTSLLYNCSDGNIDPKVPANVSIGAIEQLKNAYPDNFLGIYNGLNLNIISSLFEKSEEKSGVFSILSEIYPFNIPFIAATNGDANTISFSEILTDNNNGIASANGFNGLYKDDPSLVVALSFLTNYYRLPNTPIKINSNDYWEFDGITPTITDKVYSNSVKFLNNGFFNCSDNVISGYVLSKTQLLNFPDFAPFILKEANGNYTLQLKHPDYYFFNDGFKMGGSNVINFNTPKIYSFPNTWPTATDSYSSYLQGNRNSLDTSLNIAKQQATTNAVFGVLGGIASIATGGLSALTPTAKGEMNPTSGVGSVVSGAMGIASSITNSINSYQNSVKTQRAKLADLSNSATSVPLSSSDFDTALNIIYTSVQYNMPGFDTGSSGASLVNKPEIVPIPGTNNPSYEYITREMYANSIFCNYLTLPVLVPQLTEHIRLFNYLAYMFGGYADITLSDYSFILGVFGTNLSVLKTDYRTGNYFPFVYLEAEFPDALFDFCFTGESFEIKKAMSEYMSNPLRIWIPKDHANIIKQLGIAPDEY